MGVAESLELRKCVTSSEQEFICIDDSHESKPDDLCDNEIFTSSPAQSYSGPSHPEIEEYTSSSRVFGEIGLLPLQFAEIQRGFSDAPGDRPINDPPSLIESMPFDEAGKPHRLTPHELREQLREESEPEPRPGKLEWIYVSFGDNNGQIAQRPIGEYTLAELEMYCQIRKLKL